jgi:hypothetical protein
MATKNDIAFRWLQVMHIIEDWDKKKDPTGRNVREELQKKFTIQQRKPKK